MKFSIYLMAMFAATVGYILSTFIGEKIDFPEIITAIFWFLIALTTYMGAKRLKEVEYFGLISLDFIFTWAFTTIGVIIGDIILVLIDESSITLNSDRLLNVFYATLPLALGPTASASLGLRE